MWEVNQKPLPNHKNIINTLKSSDKYLSYLILLGIIILTLIVYSETFKNGFTNWDDDTILQIIKIYQNLSVQGLLKYFLPFTLILINH